MTQALRQRQLGGKRMRRAPLLASPGTAIFLCMTHLYAGLVGHSPAAGFPLEPVARQYSYWHDAGAFGGGQVRCSVLGGVSRGAIQELKAARHHQRLQAGPGRMRSWALR